jgi:CDGSH-type Zn-finger protein
VPPVEKELREITMLLKEIKSDLEELKAIDAVQRLIVTYARGCDRGNDPAVIGPLFAEDGTWECKGFGKYVGRDRVAKGLKGIAGEKIWWSLHYMISPLIEIAPDGRSGTAFWYLWESATVPEAQSNQATPHWIGGTYDTDLVKVDGRWLFKRMELKLNMVSPYQSGWVKERFLGGSRETPYLMDLDPGTYHWCACGRSKNQPFCDGSHKGTQRQPMEFTLQERSHVALCGCKYSKTKPHCDGSHLKLKLD